MGSEMCIRDSYGNNDIVCNLLFFIAFLSEFCHTLAMETNKKSIQSRIGAAVVAWRIEESLDQQELADRAGVHRRTVSNLERGHGATLETLTRVLDALGRSDVLDLLTPPEVNPLAIADGKTALRRVAGVRSKR